MVTFGIPQRVEAPSVAKDMQESPQGVVAESNLAYYVHIPETGSGFAATVAHHGRRENLQKTWLSATSGSLPDVDVTGESDMSHVYDMFRDPAQWALSGYFVGLQNCWCL